MPRANSPFRTERMNLIRQLRGTDQNQKADLVAWKQQELAEDPETDFYNVPPSYGVFDHYLKALDELDSRVDVLYEIEAMGLEHAVSPEEREELLKLYRRIGAMGDEFLQRISDEKRGARKNSPAADAARKLQEHLARDYNALLRYDPSVPKPFSELQESSSLQTVDLANQNIQTLGNMQSARIPMTLRGPNGETRTGVFTKARRVEAAANFRKLLEQTKKLCGQEGQQKLDSFLDAARAYYTDGKHTTRSGARIREDVSQDYIIASIQWDLKGLRDDRKGEEVSEADIRSLMQKMNFDPAGIPPAALKALASGSEAMLNDVGNEINGYNLELTDGTRLDQRNSAMSAAAEMLGIGQLLARSDNMRFRGEDGAVVEGSFMDFGKGLDLDAHPEQSVHMNDHPLSDAAKRNRLLKDIADLQILDLICLNVDRHEGNVMYRVDQKGFINGLQGIDNDSSMGLRYLREDEIGKCRVVSKSMADKLMRMTPGELRFGLRGLGLSEEELSAAEDRLDQVRTNIMARMIRTVPDDEFYKLKEEELSHPKHSQNPERKNMFDRVLGEIRRCERYRKKHALPFEPIDDTVPPELTRTSDVRRRFTVAGLADAAENVGKLLRDKSKNFKVEDLTKGGRTSEEFKEMVEAARIVAHLPKYLENQAKKPQQAGPDAGEETWKPNPNALLSSPDGAACRKYYDTAFSNLRMQATNYLSKKMNERHALLLSDLVGKNPYEQRRIDYAKKLLDATTEYEKLAVGPEEPEALREEREMQTRRSEADRREALRKVREYQQAHGLPAEGEQPGEKQPQNQGGAIGI